MKCPVFNLRKAEAAAAACEGTAVTEEGALGDDYKGEDSNQEAKDWNRKRNSVDKQVSVSVVFFLNLGNTTVEDEIEYGGQKNVHQGEPWGESYERFFIFFLPFLFQTSPTLGGAAHECEISEDRHEDNRGVGEDGLDNVTVPAGGDTKEKIGEEHCRKDCCKNWEVMF